ncbi:MAG: rhomboid family intramembrane serine protease [Candidatus Competibacteraceae bacterium]|nr:rhomboid family intramembrane serine protease [Candidatus Competibacteraceae bacterium]
MDNLSFQNKLLRVTPHLYVIPVLIGVNLLVFISMSFVGTDTGIEASDSKLYLSWGGNFRPLTAGGEWWRLLTSAFLHVGFLHLLFNLWVLFEVGRLAERLYGNGYFVFIYLGSALIGSLSSILWYQQRISVGASGAVFGVYGALIAYLIIRRHTLPPFIIRNLLIIAAMFIGISISYGLFQQGIDNAAHIGGLLGGFLLGIPLSRPLEPRFRSAHAGKRVLLAIAGLLSITTVMASYVPKPLYDVQKELAFQDDIDWFRTQEETANTAYNRLIGEAKQGKLSEDQLADQLGTEVLMIWRSIVQRFSDRPLSKASPSFKAYQLTSEFSTLRRDALIALISSLRQRNPADFQAFRAFQTKAEQLLEEMKQLATEEPR